MSKHNGEEALAINKRDYEEQQRNVVVIRGHKFVIHPEDSLKNARPMYAWYGCTTVTREQLEELAQLLPERNHGEVQVQG